MHICDPNSALWQFIVVHAGHWISLRTRESHSTCRRWPGNSPAEVRGWRNGSERSGKGWQQAWQDLVPLSHRRMVQHGKATRRSSFWMYPAASFAWRSRCDSLRTRCCCCEEVANVSRFFLWPWNDETHWLKKAAVKTSRFLSCSEARNPTAMVSCPGNCLCCRRSGWNSLSQQLGGTNSLRSLDGDAPAWHSVGDWQEEYMHSL